MKHTLLFIILLLYCSFLNGQNNMFMLNKYYNPRAYAKVTSITDDRCYVDVSVPSNGGSFVKSSGLIVNTSTGFFDLTDYNIRGTLEESDSNDNSIHSFSFGVSPSTTYWVKGYMITIVDTTYTSSSGFTTPPSGSIPTLTTTNITGITSNSATSGGNISNDGGGFVFRRGICWRTYSNPTINDNFTADGSGSGSFSSTASVLAPGTTYYVKAYATNSYGTGYGNQIIFTTLDVPTVSIINIDDVTQTSARLFGNVSNDGGTAVTERGFVYSATSELPTLSDNVITVGSGTGLFDAVIYGLPSGTEINVRSYAINSVGTSYQPNSSKITTFSETMVPIVTTSSASSIGITSATLGGSVTNDAGSTVTERGIVYNTTGSPTTSSNKVQIGSGIGSFSQSVTGLSSNTTYYVKAYAKNSNGISYGNQVQFTTEPLSCIQILNHIYTEPTQEATCASLSKVGHIMYSNTGYITNATVLYGGNCSTPASSGWYKDAGASTVRYWNGSSFTVTTTCSPILPIVSTDEVIEITTSSAVSGGSIQRDGWDDITDKGICYNTTGSPDINDNLVSSGSGNADFISILNNLSSNTTYYVRAYAINSAGVGYGSQEYFTTAEQQIACGGSTSYSGEETYPGVYAVTLGSEIGVVTFSFDAKDVPDKFVVVYDGEEVINTGYRGSTTYQASLNNAISPDENIISPGNGIAIFSKLSSVPVATVYVYAPLPRTGWDFLMSCPKAPSVDPQGITLTNLTSDIEEGMGGVTPLNGEKLYPDVTVNLSHSEILGDSTISVSWLATIKEGVAHQDLVVYVSYTTNDGTNMIDDIIQIDEGSCSGTLNVSYEKPTLPGTSYEVKCQFDTSQLHTGYNYGRSPVFNNIENE